MVLYIHSPIRLQAYRVEWYDEEWVTNEEEFDRRD
jgi:hypothetical protein